MSLIRNLKSRGFKDILNPKKIKIWFRYILLKLRNKNYPELSIDFKLEQIAYRMMEPGCRACIYQGECVICHCPSPQQFYDQNNYCSGMNWVEMKETKEEWEVFKKENNIIIPIEYIDQIKQYGVIKKWLN